MKESTAAVAQQNSEDVVSDGVEAVCRTCSGMFVVCRSCWRGQAYCSLECHIALVDRPPDGIILELKLVPHERFWRGFNLLIDMMIDGLLKKRGKKINENYLTAPGGFAVVTDLFVGSIVDIAPLIAAMISASLGRVKSAFTFF